ncbi:3-deoxy-7-phosphoheptulonate synthase [Francisella philomiragia]
MIGDKNFDKVSNINIKKEKVLIPAEVLIQDIPLLKTSFETVRKSRKEIAEIIHGKDDRVAVIVGPCSIHDTEAAIEYAKKLKEQVKKFQKEILIIMRVYFEKPRTTIGWKGLINDPDLDNSYNINKGLRMARTLLSDITSMGLPCGTEFLDVITPQYFAELITWGAIGARTVESQVHRELASGLSASIGFKNATNGDIQVAVDAIKSATYPHHFLSTTKSGSTAIFATKGNQNGHIILRGGASGPNFSKEHVDDCIEKLKKSEIDTKVMIDCSHGNSKKDHTKQISVLEDICEQIKTSNNVFGIMIESNLVAGNQDINNKPLTYGQSVTDKCVDFDETIKMLEMLADAVKARRNSQEKVEAKEESQFSLL